MCKDGTGAVVTMATMAQGNQSATVMVTATVTMVTKNDE